MIEGRTLPTVLQTILDQAASRRDFMVPNAVMTMTEDLELRFAEQTLGVNENFHDQMGTYLGIPSKFYDRLRKDHPDLISINVNRLLAEKSQERRLIRALGTTARANLSDRYRRLDHEDVAAHILPFLAGSDLEVKSAEVTDSKLYLQILAPKVRGEVRVGDEVQAGFVISNSEIGRGSLNVQPLVYRLRCTNGMIVQDMAKRHAHLGSRNDYIDADFYEVMTDETRQLSDQALFLQTRDFLQHIVSPTGFNTVLNVLREKAGEPVNGDPVRVVEELSSKVNLRQEESKSVLYAFLQEGDFCRWGLANAITAQANDNPN